MISRIVVPISGGKDSQLCLHRAVTTYGADFVTAVHQHTHFDHSLTYQHLQFLEKHYGCELVNVASQRYRDVPHVIVGERIIPSRFARACTKHLKLRPWYEWLRQQPDLESMEVWLGMRAAESPNRRENYGALSPEDLFTMGDLGAECTQDVAFVRCRLPIVDMSTPAVYQELRETGVPINPLYSRGHSRVGCYPCVLAGSKDFRLAVRDPEGRQNIIWMKEAIDWVQGQRDMDLGLLFEHDLAALLAAPDADPLGFNDEDDGQGGCAWCSL